jgi:type IV pilus assembly protein PilW
MSMTQSIRTTVSDRRSGFGLVEIMVGLAIGLIATLVIVQVVSTYEGQKRTTMGTADAQTNGSIALYTIQRQAQMAGYGLPVFSYKNQPLSCAVDTAYDPDADPLTNNSIGLFPINVIDGGDGASDVLILRSGQTPMGGVPNTITGVLGNDVFVTNNLSCQPNDVVLVANGAACAMTQVTAAGIPDPAVNTTQIGLRDVAGVGAGADLACMSNWREMVYQVVNGNLVENGVPSVTGIVNMQVQYGVSATATDNQVNAWVDPTGATWGNTALTPSVENRNRIKAIRVAIVARNGLLEKDPVTPATCPTAKGVVNDGPCAWDDSAVDAAPRIDLSGDADWRRYRYRVFETIIPLRNIIWAKDTLL